MKFIALIVFILMTHLGGFAQAAFQVPALQGPVMDQVGYIKNSDQRELSALLQDYNRRGKAQIQVLVIPSLEGEAIESASIRITDAWKLGDAKKDNGVLFLISAGDRRLRIEVGQGLEGALTDLQSKRIISDTVIPYFKAGKTSQGIVAGVYEIIRAVDKEFADEVGLADPSPKKNNWIILIVFVVLLLIIIGGGRGGGRGRRAGLFYGGAGGFGGWSGGGGFGGSGGGGGWSGGGGGFSGGGASGSW